MIYEKKKISLEGYEIIWDTFERYKIIYHNGSYLLLFGKRGLLKFWNFMWKIPLTL